MAGIDPPDRQLESLFKTKTESGRDAENTPKESLQFADSYPAQE